MLYIGLQFFAHKKGMGSTKNGRDSAGRRLGAKASDGEIVSAGPDGTFGTADDITSGGVAADDDDE